jgi:signal transduction histidine kinase
VTDAEALRRSVVAGVRRHRLAAVLALPTILLVVVAGFGISGQIQVANRADDVVRGVDLVLATQDLIHSLQLERGLSAGIAGGSLGFRGQLDAQRPTSDQARAALDRQLADDHSESADAVRSALGKLAGLGSMRKSVDAQKIDWPSVFKFYTDAITSLNNATHVAEIQTGQDDREMRRDMQELLILGDGKEAAAEERGQLNGGIASGTLTQSEYTNFLLLRSVKLDDFSQFSALASGKQEAALNAVLRTPAEVTAADYENGTMAWAWGPRYKRLMLSPTVWWNAMTQVIDVLRGVQQGIGKGIQGRAQQIKSHAIVQLTFYSSGAVLALVLAVLLWLYTIRSITRPLGILTREAHEASEGRLPMAMARIQAAEHPKEVILDTPRSALVNRGDEFSQVAKALDRLQATALRLTVEQAVLRRHTAESLANLGRRNQNLVRRQLGFISALEREETNPDALANFFKLDHLATRMRRNAESLLVLVGQHSPRRWSSSVAVGDVLRSAFAEVEDYQRIVLRRVDDTRVSGAAAADIAHLLAELIENALTFSPPNQEVDIQAHGTDSGCHIVIVDQGIGMPPEAMNAANARLRGQRGEQEFLVAPSRNLGHYVVGQLAQRLGIRVWLHDTPLSGVTAQVVLPAALLDTSAQPAAHPAALAAPKVLPRREVMAGTGPAPVATAAMAASSPLAWPERPRERSENGMTPAPARTRNGLVKRRPGEYTIPRSEEPPRPHPPAADERSPKDVQSMLNNLRVGIIRGEQARPDDKSN